MSAVRQFDGLALKSRRQQSRVSREVLAASVGRSVNSVRAWEQGRQSPSLQVLEHVAATVGCSVDDLLVEVDQ